MKPIKEDATKKKQEPAATTAQRPGLRVDERTLREQEVERRRQRSHWLRDKNRERLMGRRR